MPSCHQLSDFYILHRGKSLPYFQVIVMKHCDQLIIFNRNKRTWIEDGCQLEHSYDTASLVYYPKEPFDLANTNTQKGTVRYQVALICYRFNNFYVESVRKTWIENLNGSSTSLQRLYISSKTDIFTTLSSDQHDLNCFMFL